MIGDGEDDMEEEEEIVPQSQPPMVPEDGTYITALNEAGVDPERIEQLQQSKSFILVYLTLLQISMPMSSTSSTNTHKKKSRTSSAYSTCLTKTKQKW